MDNDRLDVYLADGEVADVRLNGESVWPTWFKIEWKGNGELSAKVQGVRLATSRGDEIRIHQGEAPAPAKCTRRAANAPSAP